MSARRYVGVLKLSNLLQLDRFQKDLNITRVRLQPRAPLRTEGAILDCILRNPLSEKAGSFCDTPQPKRQCSIPELQALLFQLKR